MWAEVLGGSLLFSEGVIVDAVSDLRSGDDCWVRRGVALNESLACGG